MNDGLVSGTWQPRHSPFSPLLIFVVNVNPDQSLLSLQVALSGRESQPSKNSLPSPPEVVLQFTKRIHDFAVTGLAGRLPTLTSQFLPHEDYTLRLTEWQVDPAL